MIKDEALLRRNYIIEQLKKKPSSKQEILEYLEIKSVNDDNNYTCSERTFDRDIKKIRTIHKLPIEYKKSRNVYLIDDDGDSARSDILRETLDLYHIISKVENLSNFILLESVRPKGTANLYGLVHAIKNHIRIKFDYSGYGSTYCSHKQIEPYFLKEFNNRWYLIGKDLKDNEVKTFGLDRLSDLETTKRKFSMPNMEELKNRFKNSYGIYTNLEKEPEEVMLSFTPEKGVYIKSLPLHESQEILVDDDNELRIKLRVYTSIDFVMELLSHGSHVKVLKPASLIEILKADYKKALAQYGA